MSKANSRKFEKSKLLQISLAFVVLLNLCFLAVNIYLFSNYKNYVGECRSINSQRVCTGAYDGLTEKQAVEKAQESGLSARVVHRDSEMIFRTDDLNHNRLNFSIENNIVIGTEFY